MLVLLVGDPFMAHVLRYSVQGCCKVYRVCLGQVMVAMHRGRVMDEGVSQYRVLLIDNDEALTRLLADELGRDGFAAAHRRRPRNDSGRRWWSLHRPRARTCQGRRQHRYEPGGGGYDV